MSENPCYELVVYRLKADTDLTKWHTAHQHILDQLARLPGFIAAETDQSHDDTLTYCDHVYWESTSTAQNANQTFKTLTGVDTMQSMVEDILLSGIFEAHE